MFYSEKSHVTIYDNATNWNGSGWQEIFAPPSKFSVKVFKKSDFILPGKYKDKYSYFFYINATFLG